MDSVTSCRALESEINAEHISIQACGHPKKTNKWTILPQNQSYNLLCAFHAHLMQDMQLFNYKILATGLISKISFLHKTGQNRPINQLTPSNCLLMTVLPTPRPNRAIGLLLTHTQLITRNPMDFNFTLQFGEFLVGNTAW